MEKASENVRIVNQKSLHGIEEPTVLVYCDVTHPKKTGTIYNLYGRDSINAMITVCMDALEED